VNFGLFLTVWDHLLGTFHYEKLPAPLRSEDVGIGNEPDYPQGYLAQLMKPFRPAAAKPDATMEG
jgi:sterol desaturase/sphingolipid hydroxylase (fatty acid hydroxylase superfamily)